MDVARIFILFVFAATSAGSAFAAKQPPATPLQHTAHFAGQSGWPSAGTTAPTITANPNDRYAFPQPNTGAASPPSITDRTQNAFSETANTLRDGFEAGVRAAAGQTFGTTATPSQSTNPFAAPAPVAPTNTRARGAVAPPPNWPSSSTAPTTLVAPTWNGSALPPAPVNPSMMTATPTTPPVTGWSSIGSTVPAPPLLIPQLPNSTNNFARIGNTAIPNTTAFPTDGFRTQPSIHSPLVTPAQQSTAATTVRATPAADDFAASWDKNAPTAPPTIGRSGTGSTLGSTNRDSNFASSQSSATIAQDTKKTTTVKNDAWPDDNWLRQPQSPPVVTASPASSATVTKSTPFTSAANSPSASSTQPGAPVLAPPAIGSATGNTNLAGSTSAAAPSTTAANPAKPSQQSTTPPTGDAPPWVPLLAAILTLAGSLAANLYLGWSYLDARQKYQSLVRRTADTFRRTKPAAA